jgi:hypothetical protein
MGVPTTEVSYTSAAAGSGDHEVHKGHVVALGGTKSSCVEVCLTKEIFAVPENLALKKNTRMNTVYLMALFILNDVTPHK